MSKFYSLPFVALLSITPILSFGQETKKVNLKFQNPTYREEYTVLKTDPEIKQGVYRRYVGDPREREALAVQGYYTNGQKDSLWTQYNPWERKVVQAKGHYRQDQKVGVWEYYAAKDEVEQRYDHTQHKLLFQQPEKKAPSNITFKPGAKVNFEIAPVYIGGYSSALRFISENLKYPVEALRSQLSGTVIIAFTVANDGTVSDYRVAKSAAPSLDEESLRVVKLVPATWIPAQTGGQPVEADCNFTVSFGMK